MGSTVFLRIIEQYKKRKEKKPKAFFFTIFFFFNAFFDFINIFSIFWSHFPLLFSPLPHQCPFKNFVIILDMCNLDNFIGFRKVGYIDEFTHQIRIQSKKKNPLDSCLNLLIKILKKKEKKKRLHINKKIFSKTQTDEIEKLLRRTRGSNIYCNIKFVQLIIKELQK